MRPLRGQSKLKATQDDMSEDAQPDRSQILAALEAVKDPKSGQGLSSAGLVRGLSIRGKRAAFMLEVPAADVTAYEPVRDAAEAAEAAPDLKVTPRHAPRSASGGPPRARVQEDPQARLGNMPEAERPPFVGKV